MRYTLSLVFEPRFPVLTPERVLSLGPKTERVDQKLVPQMGKQMGSTPIVINYECRPYWSVKTVEISDHSHTIL